jgi:hypothetical protein
MGITEIVLQGAASRAISTVDLAAAGAHTVRASNTETINSKIPKDE